MNKLRKSIKVRKSKKKYGGDKNRSKSRRRSGKLRRRSSKSKRRRSSKSRRRRSSKSRRRSSKSKVINNDLSCIMGYDLGPTFGKKTISKYNITGVGKVKCYHCHNECFYSWIEFINTGHSKGDEGKLLSTVKYIGKRLITFGLKGIKMIKLLSCTRCGLQMRFGEFSLLRRVGGPN